MFRKILMLISRVIFSLILLFVLILISSRLYVLAETRGSIYQLTDSPQAPVAIVFGAGLRRDGSPTLILRDRVETAVRLYQAGKVQKILMSGDNRFIEYNEPAAMREFAIGLGVPAEDIVLDYAGRSTYETCYRAKAIFEVNEALLVTNPFHLPRAVYTCQQLGIDVSGVRAELETYRKSSHIYWEIRELPATANALWQLYISHPIPVLGDKEPINLHQ
jgi:SanA protein